MNEEARWIGCTAGLSAVIAGLVVLQAAWAAMVGFGIYNETRIAGRIVDLNYQPNVGAPLHAIGGQFVIPAIAIVLLVVAFFVTIPGAVRLALFIVLAVAVQISLAFMSMRQPGIGALHGLGAFVILGLAIRATTRRSPAPMAQSQ